MLRGSAFRGEHPQPRNPYAAAAKFVMSRNATERDVKRTASAIARSIAEEAKKRQP